MYVVVFCFFCWGGGGGGIVWVVVLFPCTYLIHMSSPCHSTLCSNAFIYIPINVHMHEHIYSPTCTYKHTNT